MEPRASGLLEVEDDQRIYWEEWGNPDGVPAVHLHGGPGGGLGRSGYRRNFDLDRTRVIGFDQRGCGRSLPHVSDPGVSLADNTTAELIADMEALREALGIERWLVTGASWGSTLALAYAQRCPDRVLGITIMAATTTRRWEVDWITETVGAIYPQAWDRLATHAEQAGIGYRRGHGRLVRAYADLLNAADPAVRDAASREWALWEDSHIAVGAGGYSPSDMWDDDRFRLAFCRLVTHYWAHDGFCDPPLLDRMDLLHGIPGAIIHGTLDVSGPAVTAWQLHRNWPGSTLVIIENEGHGGPVMVDHWRAANLDLISRFG